MEVVHGDYYSTMLSLPLHTIFILLLLLAGNALLKPRASRWVLSQGELLTIYVMLAIAGVIAGFGQLQALIAWVAAPLAKATPEGRWQFLFFQYLPQWLVLTDKDSVERLLMGESSMFTSGNLQAWFLPALWWGAFFLAVFVAILCLNTLLRRRWIEEEKLAFPLVQLPLAITEPTGTLFRSRLLWVGFMIAALLNLLSGLHVLYPSIPSLQIDFSGFNRAVADFPGLSGEWGGAFWPPYPWAVGAAMFMPLDVSFSYWFFFWFMKVETVLTTVWGWDVAPGAPFPYAQCAGALITIGIYSLWSARRHLLQVMRSVLRSREDPRDAEEPLHYRNAVGLLVLSLVFLSVFAWRAGAPLWLVPLFLGLYLTAMLALSRIRAELGPPAYEILYAGPHTILSRIVSPASFPVPALVMLTVFGWTSRSYGCDPTPLQMEGFKMAERTGLRTRGLAAAMLLAAAAGLIAGFVAVLYPLYHLGAKSKLSFYLLDSAGASFSELQNWLTGMPSGQAFQGLAVGGGSAFVLFLYAMRARFLGWPLLPVGYLMAPTWFAHHLWISVFLAWLAKLLLLRYGGLRAYVRALPLFFGLILGDCVMGSIWALIGLVHPLPPMYVWGVI